MHAQGSLKKTVSSKNNYTKKKEKFCMDEVVQSNGRTNISNCEAKQNKATG